MSPSRLHFLLSVIQFLNSIFLDIKKSSRRAAMLDDGLTKVPIAPFPTAVLTSLQTLLPLPSWICLISSFIVAMSLCTIRLTRSSLLSPSWIRAHISVLSIRFSSRLLRLSSAIFPSILAHILHCRALHLFQQFPVLDLGCIEDFGIWLGSVFLFVKFHRSKRCQFSTILCKHLLRSNPSCSRGLRSAIHSIFDGLFLPMCTVCASCFIHFHSRLILLCCSFSLSVSVYLHRHLRE